jgi:hypothetical protein
MKWPWQRQPENRGTLTFLPDGQVILGMPHGASEQMTHGAFQALREHLAENTHKAFVFPFLVDVVDKRGSA